MYRPNCISALVRVRNEEWWIELSTLSVKDLVRQYVVVDASTDRTPDIIDELKSRYNLNLIHVMDDEDIAVASQRGVIETPYKFSFSLWLTVLLKKFYNNSLTRATSPNILKKLHDPRFGKLIFQRLTRSTY